MAYAPSIDNKVITTNSTLNVAETIPLLTNDIIYVELMYEASTANGAATIVGSKGGFFKNVSGTSSLIGSVTAIMPHVADASLSAATIDLAANGSNVVLRITGVAGSTITWNYLINYYRRPI